MNPYLQTAINEVGQLHSGEQFIVKDLFKGYLWNRIPRNERLALGSIFLDWISNSNSNVQILDKNSSNQQMYMKL